MSCQLKYHLLRLSISHLTSTSDSVKTSKTNEKYTSKSTNKVKKQEESMHKEQKNEYSTKLYASNKRKFTSVESINTNKIILLKDRRSQ